MFNFKAFILSSIILATVSVKESSAITIGQLDQENIGSGVGADINGGFKFIGQTYTAGLTGFLTGINVNISRFQNADPLAILSIAIHNVLNEKPTNQILSETLITGGSGLGNFISLPLKINQVEGQMYAIVASFKNAPLGQGQGIWEGTANNQYTKGFAFGTNDFISFDVGVPEKSFDNVFRTYIETRPVPEGTSIVSLLTFAIVGMVATLQLNKH